MSPTRLLPLLLLLSTAVPAAEPVAVIPPMIEPGTLDVRANVMRMLEEARGRPSAAEDELPAAPAANLPAEVPADSVPPVDVRASVMQKLREEGTKQPPPVPAKAAPPAADRLRARRPAEERPDWYEGTLLVVPPANEAELRGDYVPVPHKSITINSLDDLQQLRDEFAEGRKRKTAP